MVIYRGADGKPGYHQTDDIHDAVSFVEQMTNNDGVEHARIFRLEEVVFQYRAYYRVELAEGTPTQVERATAGSIQPPMVSAPYPKESVTSEADKVMIEATKSVDLVERDTDSASATNDQPINGLDITNGSEDHSNDAGSDQPEIGAIGNNKGLFGR